MYVYSPSGLWVTRRGAYFPRRSLFWPLKVPPGNRRTLVTSLPVNMCIMVIDNLSCDGFIAFWNWPQVHYFVQLNGWLYQMKDRDSSQSKTAYLWEVFVWTIISYFEKYLLNHIISWQTVFVVQITESKGTVHHLRWAMVTMVQWLDCRTCSYKVVGSNPTR